MSLNRPGQPRPSQAPAPSGNPASPSDNFAPAAGYGGKLSQRQASASSASGQPAPSSSGGSLTKPPPLTLEQSRVVARTHYDSLRDYLGREGALAAASTRTNAREKLQRLTRQQLMELSTDVHDELNRRLEDQAGRPGDQPFLPVRPEFHPKRNQARQKLATLPDGRYRDLASDVLYELNRRYPEFAEGDQPQETLADPVPREQQNYSSPPVASSSGGQRHSRSESLGSLPPSSSGSNLAAVANGPPPTGLAARRAPTPQSSNDIVVPNKSTLVMEEPSSGGSGFRSASGSTPASPNDGNGNRERRDSFTSQPGFAGLTKGPSQFGHGRSGSQSQSQSYGSTRPLSPQDRSSAYERQEAGSGGALGNGARNTSFSRASETSSVGTRFIGNYAGSMAASEAGGTDRNWEAEEREKIKADYEYKLTMIQRRVQELERENEDAREALKQRSTEQARARDLEEQVRTHRERYESQNSSFQQLRQDYDALQTTRSRDISSSSDTGRLRSEVDRLNRERGEAEELANELRAEVSSLVDELRSVNERYEDVLEVQETSKREAEKKDEEARMWKKKWEQAKTELRNMKATSQLFTSSIKVEGDFMPASSDGLIADIHVSSFQTSIDDLLQAARSKETSAILGVARNVVSAVDKIDSDVQAIDDRRLSTFSPADLDLLQSLKAKIHATLSNLMTASKNHATSFGVSPVSLVDAAASHLSNTVVDLVRLLKIRRTTAASRMALDARNTPMPTLSESPQSPPPPLPPSKPNGYLSGSLGSVKSALGAIGLGGQPRDRDSKDAATIASPTPSYQQNAAVRSPGGQSDYSTTSQSRGGHTDRPYPAPMQLQENNSWEKEQRNMHSSSNSRDNDSFRQATSPPQRNYDHSPSNSFNQFNQRQQGNGGPQQSYDDRDDRRFESSPPPQPQGSALGNYSSSEGGSYSYGGQDGAYQGQYGSNGGTVLDYGGPGEEARGQENNAEELKSYIETQTEAIVHSIQSLLSAIRSGAQGEQLNENLTQIITIVSSIVAISRDALPTSARDEGDEILRDLTDNCDKLSEMQGQSGRGTTTFTKQTKQAMAGASFGLAKGLRELNRLLE